MWRNIKIFSIKKKRKKFSCDNLKNLYDEANYLIFFTKNMATIVQTNSQETKKQTFLQSLMAIMTTLIGLSATIWTIQNWKNAWAQWETTKIQTQILENQNKLISQNDNFENYKIWEQKRQVAREQIFEFEKKLSNWSVTQAVFEKLSNNIAIDNQANLDGFIRELNAIWNAYCDWTISSLDLKLDLDADYSKICASELVAQYSGSKWLGAICKNLYPTISWISNYSCK